MVPVKTFQVSQKISEQFLGREEALQQFKRCLLDESEVKGIYYCGPGGFGKTWILERILGNYSGEPTWLICPLIDFYPTKHHSIRGLQQTLRSFFSNPEVFTTYDKTLHELGIAQQPETNVHPNRITNLEIRANYQFIDACKSALQKNKMILLFDTFERVQNQDVGHWLLRDFLPALDNLRFALAGRPDPTLVFPDYIQTYKVTGFDREETIVFLQKKDPEISTGTAENIWKHTDGIPLILNLIRDLTSSQWSRFIEILDQFENGELAQDSDESQTLLIEQFRTPGKVNMTLWAMASLWRRFDLPMLTYLASRPEWKNFASYGEIQTQLGSSPYIKEHPEAESHLLHDEIQRMISRFILFEEQFQEFFRPIHELVVHEYYPQAVKQAKERTEPTAMDDIEKRAAFNLWRQLCAEEFGYILDQDKNVSLERYEKLQEEQRKLDCTSERDRSDGLKWYICLQQEIHTQHDYALEELVWSEMRGYLERFADDRALKYRIFLDRGESLRRHSLFEKAERHYAQMIVEFQEHPVQTRLEYGFMLQRQGNFNEAERIFMECLKLTSKDDLKTIAETESALGQTARRAGHADKALEHYRKAIKAATEAHDFGRLASAYVNRAYIWASEGKQEEAKQQCRWALDLLSQMSPKERGRSEIFAHLNLGTSYRFGAEYEQADQYYREALRYAKALGDEEALCETLQHIGINQHYWGRRLRRDILEQVERSRASFPVDAPSKYQDAVSEMLQHQEQAWENLTEALNLALRADWRGAMASTLHRLAKVYREIHRIDELIGKMPKNSVQDQLSLNMLKGKALRYHIPMEAEYERRLMTSGTFEEQPDWIHRAIRLFDLAAWVADEVSDFHRTLDTLMELTRLFDEQRNWELTKQTWQRIEEVKGFDYQEDLFKAMRDISRGNLAFDRKDYQEALDQYSTAFAHLARQSGYAKVLLTDSLRDVLWRFDTQEPVKVLTWCDELEKTWEHTLKDSDKWPVIQSFLEDLRFRTIRRRKAA